MAIETVQAQTKVKLAYWVMRSGLCSRQRSLDYPELLDCSHSKTISRFQPCQTLRPGFEVWDDGGCSPATEIWGLLSPSYFHGCLKDKRRLDKVDNCKTYTVTYFVNQNIQCLLNFIKSANNHNFMFFFLLPRKVTKSITHSCLRWDSRFFFLYVSETLAAVKWLSYGFVSWLKCRNYCPCNFCYISPSNGNHCTPPTHIFLRVMFSSC